MIVRVTFKNTVIIVSRHEIVHNKHIGNIASAILICIATTIIAIVATSHPALQRANIIPLKIISFNICCTQKNNNKKRDTTSNPHKSHNTPQYKARNEPRHNVRHNAIICRKINSDLIHNTPPCHTSYVRVKARVIRPRTSPTVEKTVTREK